MPNGAAPGRLGSKTLTITLAGVGVTVVFISLLAAYFRRRQNRKRKQEARTGNSDVGASDGVDNTDSPQDNRLAVDSATVSASGNLIFLCLKKCVHCLYGARLNQTKHV